MNTTQAQSSLKKVYQDANAISPTAIITLFEIDVEDLAADRGVSLSDNEKVFRFHNHVKLLSSNIWFQNKQYFAAPIRAEGFEISSKGTLPTPKLSISANEQGIDYLALLKDNIAKLGDLVGAKVTRVRTFVKYLDRRTWHGSPPDGIAPDPNAEFPHDIYYIDRKSNEDKSTLEYELASILDVEGIKLPARLVLAQRCVWQYRGEGCCYEYATRKNDDIHGDAVLPIFAPPVATDRNELIADIIGRPIPIRSPKPYDAKQLSTYQIGACVYITKNGRNYYFVCKVNSPSLGPPNLSYWVADTCAKDIVACKLRWGTSGAVQVGASGLTKGQLPTSAFPGITQPR